MQYQNPLKNFFASILGLVMLIFFNNVFAADNSPAGYWKTVDDKTGKVLSIVEIYPVDNTMQGKIVKIMPILGQKPSDRCVKCSGALHNKPNLGLTFIWGMQQLTDVTWGRGHVLDPKNGSIYHASMTLINNGEALRLRGYIGLPIFGRTETWRRTAKP